MTSRERGHLAIEHTGDELTYIVPFQFQLPLGCHATIYYQNKEDSSKPKAKVKYWIKVRIVDLFEEDPIVIAQTKTDLVICEEPPNFEFLMMQMCEQKVMSWCCFDQGTCRGNIAFPKAVFSARDNFEAQVIIQNFNCNVALNAVTISLEQ